MAGNGGLDGWSAQSLVGCRSHEARIFLFSFVVIFFFFLMFLVPPKNIVLVMSYHSGV